MNRCVKASFAAIFLLAFTTTSAVEQRPGEDAAAKLKAIQDVLAINQRNRLFFLTSTGAPVACDARAASSSCVFPAKVEQLFDKDSNLVSCIVRADAINITYGPRAELRLPIVPIVWTLDTTTINPKLGASYVFEKPHGVLVVKEDVLSTLVLVQPITDTTVTMRHTRLRRGGSVSFYPVVIQKLDGNEMLCASADPIMVND